MLVSWNGSLETVKVLIDKKASVDIQDKVSIYHLYVYTLIAFLPGFSYPKKACQMQASDLSKPPPS